jgi:hypothetical protein
MINGSNLVGSLAYFVMIEPAFTDDLFKALPRHPGFSWDTEMWTSVDVVNKVIAGKPIPVERLRRPPKPKSPEVAASPPAFKSVSRFAPVEQSKPKVDAEPPAPQTSSPAKKKPPERTKVTNAVEKMTVVYLELIAIRQIFLAHPEIAQGQ